MIVETKVCIFCGSEFPRPYGYSATQWAARLYCGRKCWSGHARVEWQERFHSQYIKDDGGCWIWSGPRHGKGYGLFGIAGRTTQKAHRLSWELHNESIPEGLHVLHRCDNPPCVNPEHLFLGTNQDNVDDKVFKGRLRVLRGSESPASRLTEENVRAIRADARFQREIAETYGVAQTTISAIKRGLNWRQI